MLILTCPCCHVTAEETEFHGGGEAHLKRVGPGGADDDFESYLFMRENPKGVHLERWSLGAMPPRPSPRRNTSLRRSANAILIGSGNAPASPASDLPAPALTPSSVPKVFHDEHKTGHRRPPAEQKQTAEFHLQRQANARL